MENYTAEELLSIVKELGLPCEIVIDEFGRVSIEVQLGEVDWTIELGMESPFYNSVLLKAVDTSIEIPFSFANEWNEEHVTSAAYVLTDPDTKSPIPLECGDFIVVLQNSFPFYGSVTREFIEFMFHCFHEDVCEFYGLMDDDEAAEERPEVSGGDSAAEHAPIPLLEQIQLELVLNPIQSARSLARSLGILKYEVNHLLCKHKRAIRKRRYFPTTVG